MRKGSLALLLMLAACQQAKPDPEMITMDLPGPITDPVPPPPPNSLPGPAKAFQALGTEPFWSVVVDGGKLTWSNPETMPGITVAADGGSEGRGWRYTATLQGGPVELLIEQAPCSDGMSDASYAHTARFVMGARRLVGCARER